MRSIMVKNINIVCITQLLSNQLNALTKTIIGMKLCLKINVIYQTHLLFFGHFRTEKLLVV